MLRPRTRIARILYCKCICHGFQLARACAKCRVIDPGPMSCLAPRTLRDRLLLYILTGSINNDVDDGNVHEPLEAFVSSCLGAQSLYVVHEPQKKDYHYTITTTAPSCMPACPRSRSHQSMANLLLFCLGWCEEPCAKTTWAHNPVLGCGNPCWEHILDSMSRICSARLCYMESRTRGRCHGMKNKV